MAFLAPAVTWLFTSQSLIATAARFVAGSLLSSVLNRSSTEGPRLDDLTVQQSAYGVNIPLAYGTVRMAGNIIDSTDFVETKNVKKKKKLGIITVAKNTTYTYAVSPAIMLCEGPLSATSKIGRVWANGELVFDSTSNNPDAVPGDDSSYVLTFDRDKKTHAYMDELRFYRGTHDQQPDAALEAHHGVGNVPGYHGVAYVVLDNFQLEEFGNQLPNFEFELIDTVDPTVESIVENIGDRVGISIYGNQLRDDVCRGYVVTQAGHAWAAIEPLAGVYSFDLVATRARMKAVKRGATIRAHIPAGDLAGKPTGAGVQDRKDLSRADVLGLPSEVVVTYRDTARDYQNNSQRAYRDEGDTNNKVAVEVPITLTADEGARVAERMLWEAWAATRQVKFSTTRRWDGLEAPDIITLDIGSERRAFRIENVRNGRNGVIEFEGVFEDPTVYEATTQGAIGNLATNRLLLPGVSTLHPMDAAIVDDADDDYGMYYGVSAAGEGWRGATIERSDDGGASYDELTDVFVSSTVGYVLGTLGDARTDIFDEANELIVTLIGPDDFLSSVTEAQIFNGENLAWVGSADGTFGEWIQFRSVSEVGSPMVYHLTGLVRGLFGTEYAVDQHSAGEVFVLYDGSVGRSEDLAAEWNVTRRFRAVSFYTNASDAPTVDSANTGEGKRPLSPVQLRGHRNGSNDDILFTWVRRSRLRGPGLGGGTVPLGEASEEYEVDIYDGTGGGASVIRTETVSTSQFTYTEAMQTADGHTLGDPVKVAVYQMSAIRGRGRPVEGIL